MKGAIIRELLCFLEEMGGPVFVEAVIDQATLESGGAYTSVGQYSSAEPVELIVTAAKISGIFPSTISHDFGRHLFHNFLAKHRAIMCLYDNVDALLFDVDQHIHRDVEIMHPGARPPSVKARWSRGALMIEYNSHRPFADVAHGILTGCLEHFGDKRQILREDSDNPHQARFRLEG